MSNNLSEFHDMPKIQSPFRREMRDGAYIVTPEIEPGFEWVFTDPTVQAGELMGPHIQQNFLELDRPIWFPLDYLKEKASYRSYHKYPKTFENISAWFKDGLFSLMYQRFHPYHYYHLSQSQWYL